MLYYSSSNSSDGTTNITVTLRRLAQPGPRRGRRAERREARRAAAARRRCARTASRSSRRTPTSSRVVALQSSDPRYDATYLANYMKLYVVDEFKRVPGVGDATPFPARDFSMLLQLDPDKMAQLGITVSDVAAAVREQNATNPAGRLGAEPSPPGTQLTLPITTLGRLQTAGAVQRHHHARAARTARWCTSATSARRCSARGATISRGGSTACPPRSCCCTRGPAPTRSP